MHTPVIIGLGGPKGAGKSTVAAALVAARPGAVRLPFADPLKSMLETIGVPPAALYGDQKETPLAMLQGRTARHAMQTLGTEWGRECIGPGFWGDLWEFRAANCRAPVVIVDDVRFPNEAERVQRLGGIVACIYRDRAQLTAEPEHPSEDLRKIPFDLYCLNGPTLDIAGRARWLASHILAERMPAGAAE